MKLWSLGLEVRYLELEPKEVKRSELWVKEVTWFVERLINWWLPQRWVRLLDERSTDPRSLYVWNVCKTETVNVVTWFAERLINCWLLQLWLMLLAEWSIDPPSQYLWNVCKTKTVNVWFAERLIDWCSLQLWLRLLHVNND